MPARKVHGAKAALGDPSGWRARIETTKLLNRLQKFSFGELELTRDQVAASKILLAKVLPDQTESKVDHSGAVTIERVTFSKS